MSNSRVEKKIELAASDNSPTIDLSYMELTTLPTILSDITNLTSINLSNNQLTTLPETLSRLTNLIHLILINNKLISLPETLGNLTNLTVLCLRWNQLAALPETLNNLTNLTILDLRDNQITFLPESFDRLTNLDELCLSNNQITKLPQNLKNLINLTVLYLDDNPLTDLSPLQGLPETTSVWFLGVRLPCRYWTKLLEWKAEWLLDEENVEIRRLLIQQVGYEKICQELAAVELDSWREYTLLKIEANVDVEPIVLLKMICPSTAYIHVLRVPPNMKSAEEAITWVNWGIHPDEFAVAT